MSETVGPSYFYIHVAKTAGMAIFTELHKRFGGRQTTLSKLPHALATGKFIFASVRNPYDRCLSLWHSLVSPGDFYGVIAAGKTDPVELLKYIVSGEFLKNGHVRRAGHLSQSCTGQIGDVKLDAVLHFETLLADFNKLPFVKEPLTELPLVNRKPRGRPERWPLKIPEFCQLVEQWCAKDFVRYGYEVGVMPEETP